MTWDKISYILYASTIDNFLGPKMAGSLFRGYASLVPRPSSPTSPLAAPLSSFFSASQILDEGEEGVETRLRFRCRAMYS